MLPEISVLAVNISLELEPCLLFVKDEISISSRNIKEKIPLLSSYASYETIYAVLIIHLLDLIVFNYTKYEDQ